LFIYSDYSIENVEITITLKQDRYLESQN